MRVRRGEARDGGGRRKLENEGDTKRDEGMKGAQSRKG